MCKGSLFLLCPHEDSILSLSIGQSEVWDGCIQGDSNRLEQAQLHAASASIITGLPIFASEYYEMGLETFAEWREKKKLTSMYRIVHKRHQLI